MRVGITANFQFSFFSSGSPQTVLSVAETFRIAGHDITLISLDDRLWWDDLNTVKDSWKVVKASEADVDCVIEVGSSLMNPALRRGRHIWLNRKAPLFNDIESSLFPFCGERSLDGISEVWVIDEFCTPDDIKYMELITRKPVRSLPFIWTPSAIELHRQETKAPVWQQVAAMEGAAGTPWSIHICETNLSSSSSSTIPLLTMRELFKRFTSENPHNINKVIKIHNAENIKQTKFFTENVLAHVFSDIDASGQFIGRQRVVDWVYDPKSIVIAHSRFYKIRPYHFDCLWAGIPLVHNSEILCQLGDNVKRGFYLDNEISQATEAFLRVTEKPMNLDELINLRKEILDNFTPLSPKLQKSWSEALAPAPALSLPAAPAPAVQQNILRVGFTCMWDLFNPSYNMFTLALEAAIPTAKVVGVSIDSMTPGQEDVDVLIFGPFGQSGNFEQGKKRWNCVKKGIPLIHFTGENTEPVEADLNLGFKHRDGNTGNYLRLPLWMLEINWFNADAERIANPKPIPIDRCCKVYSDEIIEKTKFCAFVVSNPCQPMRNNAFQWLSSYKPVDSAGRLFNNVGDGLFAGLGGGGGELRKHEFLKKYKFCLAFENESSPGYTTEKWLHAKAAGCIPIYWGDPKFERDFDLDGCIDARNIKTPSELIELVRSVDTNTSEWLKRFSKPALDDVRRDLVRRTLSEFATRVWRLSGKPVDLEAIPRFLGDTQTLVSSKVAAEVQVQGQTQTQGQGIAQIPKPYPTTVSMDLTTFVTAANTRFIPSLQAWLTAIGSQKKVVTEIRAIVYLFSDINPIARKALSQEFPFAEFRDLGTFEPQDFAWKLWILNECMSEEGLIGKPLLYLDAGAMMCRWPREWLSEARNNGICLLEDPRQTNKSWCHDIFNSRLSVTNAELAEQQIWAGAIACIAGHPLAKHLFAEAWKWGQIKEVIAGEKWSGMKDGKPYGHRHDQSILSILSSRMSIPRIDLDSVYCDISVRQSYLTKKAFYVHRGLFQVHHPLASDIDDAWVINLDRRADRMQSFMTANPDLARAHRISAFDGSKLKLGQKLARLFAPHDFKWKKPVMGCALSHLSLWMRLVNEQPDIGSYLILEDDARLQPDWRERWEKIQKHGMPADWDVVYLGGILPPNKEGFKMLDEPVNKYLSRIKKHQLFGQPTPDRYMHFCAYAYVLSRRGAEKILEVLKAKGGYWTSADHMICNIHEHLNIYFTKPLLAGCFQDDDPAYCNSQFNDFSRVDKFDSDLWTNTERFSEEEVAAVANGGTLDIQGALDEALGVTQAAVQVQAQVQPQPEAKAQVQPEAKAQVQKASRFVSFVPMDMSKWYEYSWFKQIFSNMKSFNIDLVTKATDSPIVVVQRPHVEEAAIVLKGWSDEGLEFYVLHISDEFCSDPIDFYQLPGCKGVVRNYSRPDAVDKKVVTIPLGFHWAIPNGEPYIHTPRPPFRELMWSFVGTGWLDRKAKLLPLTQIGENKVVFMDDWNSPAMLGREETLSILLNSWCVPCPSGHNGETFRFYEALEAGAVPIVVREGNEAFLKYVTSHFQIMIANSWQHAAELVYTLKQQPEVYEKYRLGILMGWEGMKKKAKDDVANMLWPK